MTTIPSDPAKPTTTIPELARGISQCQRCPLHQTRHHAVPGVGDPNADIMFVGEGPGRQEDQKGEPFVGASGAKFDQLLQSVGIERRQVFITNVLKCRTPENRDPTAEETAACRPWLQAQIEAVKPRIIVTMGRPATQWFQNIDKISDVRGKITLHDDGYLLLPTIHPAAILRRPSLEDGIRKDFHLIKPWLDLSHPPSVRQDTVRQDTEKPEPTAPPGDPPQDLVTNLLRILEARIRALPDLAENPRRQRHGLTTLALLTRAAGRHIQKAPPSAYAQWCRHLLARCVAAGREAGQSIPQVCRACNEPYYAASTEDERGRLCPACQTPSDPTHAT